MIGTPGRTGPITADMAVSAESQRDRRPAIRSRAPDWYVPTEPPTAYGGARLCTLNKCELRIAVEAVAPHLSSVVETATS